MPKTRNSLFLIASFGLTLFGAMLLLVLKRGHAPQVDAWVHTAMAQWRMDALVPLVKMLTDMNSFTGALLFSVPVVAIFIWKRWYSDLAYFAAATLGATGLFIAVKLTVARMRPEASAIEIGGFSFPSGHTTMATAMAFALYFVLREKTGSKLLQQLLCCMALGWALLIGWSRLYLGVHWFTDVLGGFGLGLFWVTLLKLFWPSRRGGETTAG